jgi:hypothetical protein
MRRAEELSLVFELDRFAVSLVRIVDEEILADMNFPGFGALPTEGATKLLENVVAAQNG